MSGGRDLDKVDEALAEAEKAGVKIWFLRCHVEPDSLRIVDAEQQP